MKKLLLMSTVAAIALASAAQAQVAFEKGTVSLNFGIISDADITLVDAESALAFSTGNLGFQIDGAINMITDFSNFDSFGSYGLHFYKPTANGNKYGAYVSASYFLTQVGAEAMVSVGALDIEGSIGILSADFGLDNIYNATIDLYYTVNENIEVSAGYNLYFDDANSEGIFRIGGSYMLPNSDLAINAGYRDQFESSIIDIGVTWSFGGNQDMRLFGDRTSDLFFGPV